MEQISNSNMKRIMLMVIGVLIFICFILAYKLKVKSNELNLYTKKDKTNNISYRPVIVQRSNEIRLGEEYIANIYLAIINKTEIPSVIVGDSICFNTFNVGMLKDTLLFNEEFDTHEYRFTPNRKGEHTWGGVIINREEEIEQVYYFGGQYIVR